MSVYLADMDRFQEMETIYRDYFSGPPLAQHGS